MNRPLTILGIHDGHNAAACLVRDGRVLSAIAEERLTRTKNEPGYPRAAVEAVLKESGSTPDDIDIVALGTRFMHSREFYLNWDWYRKGSEDEARDREMEPQRRAHFLETRIAERKAAIIAHIGVAPERIRIVEHHLAHAATAYYGSPWAADGEDALVLTLDGSGDGLCATVSIGSAKGLTRISETKSAASIGKVYSRITFLMGMKPWEHEYKLMGLAPYADEKGLDRSYRVLRELVTIDDGSLEFRPGSTLTTNYIYPHLRAQLENHRFDWIAGAAQRLTEELVVKWVRNAIAHTGIRRVACAGGVFMNVKANMLISQLDEVTGVFVFPSCGDESIPFGAAWQAHAEERAAGKPLPIGGPLETAYLGPQFRDEEVTSALHAKPDRQKLHARAFKEINEVTARALADGAVVARCAGRMEWGARALGNRSILMDPRRTDQVRVLNAAIKQRDFWMPFAPTVLAQRQGEVIQNPKAFPSPHMLLGFVTTPRGREQLAAAVHPYDQTARPQILEPKDNPDYHDLIERFRLRTGVPGLLNTSFNVHGEPIVASPEDALSTLERSGLQFLAVGSYFVSKAPIPEAWTEGVS